MLECPPNPLNSGLAFMVICPDSSKNHISFPKDGKMVAASEMTGTRLFNVSAEQLQASYRQAIGIGIKCLGSDIPCLQIP